MIAKHLSRLCILLTVLALTAPTAQAGQFLIDLAGTGPNSSGAAAPPWNSIPNLFEGEPVDLIDADVFNMDDDVTIMALDDGFDPNNPAGPGVGTTIDGIAVPAEAVDDYLFKADDTAGTTARLRIDNLDPGTYNVSVFEGRQTDQSQFAVIWVGDDTGSNEPLGENTGNFANGFSTLSVIVNPGDSLWYRHLEDNTGGLSGMIINRTGAVPEPSSLILAALGLLGLLGFARRRRGHSRRR